MGKVKVIGGFGKKASNKSTQYYFQNRIYSISGVSPSLTTWCNGYWIYDERERERMETIKYFSMFSGIGGFEQGILESNIPMECVGYSEVDKYANSIYRRHFPTHKGWGDATTIDTRELPSFDLLIGGFPCQSFSIAGNRKGFKDCRGTLFFEIARILKDKQPKYFLFENVKNLLSHDGGRTFQTILEVLAENGYYVRWQVHNTQDYGLPQKRERVFLEGYLARECGREVFHQERNCREIMAIDNDCKQLNNHKKTHQDGRIYSDDGLSIALNHRGNNGWYKLSDDKFVTCTKDNNVYPLTAKTPQREFSKKLRSYVLEKENDGLACDDPFEIRDKFRVRKLTPIECERLQGFADDYTKYGANGELISDNQRYKCLGNAVSVPVVTNIVNRMFSKGE